MINNWNLYTPPTTQPLWITLDIIEDALCYGFEFKVENHNIYYREKDN